MMDPREFHRVATSLLSSGSEAENRTAIGRAYYAAYNLSAELVRSVGIHIVKTAEGHARVKEYLSNSGDKEVEKAAHKLDGLRTVRNQADYELDNPAPGKTPNAKLHVAVAKELISTLDTCRAEKARMETVAARFQKWRAECNYP